MYKNPEDKRIYMRKYMRKRRKDKKFYVQQRKYNKDWLKRNTKLVEEVLYQFKKYGCRLCPEKEFCCLSAHHLRDKEFVMAGARCLSVDRVIEELKKCICLCENCHRKVHAGIVKLPPTAGIRP